MRLGNIRSKILRPLMAFAVGGFVSSAQAEDYRPDILVLGDSQLSFGSGPVFLDFFQNLSENCGVDALADTSGDIVAEDRVAVIGVRSTSLHSWVAKSGRSKGSVCWVDKKWNANAGSYGTVNNTKNKYVQIGRGEQYQFCNKGSSPFQAMFKDGYYDPKLLVMSFLGNAAQRWAFNKESAIKDVRATMDQLPPDLACVFMTSAPSYRKKSVNLRRKAQENLKAAFAETGHRCSFVDGFTDQTIAANQGNASHFRRKKNGRVKDPFHPNQRAARKFFELQKPHLCRAVLEQLTPSASMLAMIEQKQWPPLR